MATIFSVVISVGMFVIFTMLGYIIGILKDDDPDTRPIRIAYILCLILIIIIGFVPESTVHTLHAINLSVPLW